MSKLLTSIELGVGALQGPRGVSVLLSVGVFVSAVNALHRWVWSKQCMFWTFLKPGGKFQTLWNAKSFPSHSGLFCKWVPSDLLSICHFQGESQATVGIFILGDLTFQTQPNLVSKSKSFHRRRAQMACATLLLLCWIKFVSKFKRLFSCRANLHERWYSCNRCEKHAETDVFHSVFVTNTHDLHKRVVGVQAPRPFVPSVISGEKPALNPLQCAWPSCLHAVIQMYILLAEFTISLACTRCVIAHDVIKHENTYLLNKTNCLLIHKNVGVRFWNSLFPPWLWSHQPKNINELCTTQRVVVLTEGDGAAVDTRHAAEQVVCRRKHVVQD